MVPERSPRSILFVCTGNTCRSPLAEGLCKRMLADRLGCELEELPSKGFAVRSAGALAYPGEEASAVAVEVASEFRVELKSHRSQPVYPELLDSATDVIAVTQGHRAILMGRFPNVGPAPQLLNETADVNDPIGGDIEEYRACARQIAEYLEPFIRGWLRI